MHSNLNLDKVYLNVNFFVECTTVEGPGKRFCIWLQGCNLGCNNCINQEMLSFEPKKIMNITKLIRLIEKAKEKHDIEGVTFLGGEPFLQARNLALLAKFCKGVNLSILSFSGFKYEYLKINKLDGSKELLDNLDVLIDDIYIENLRDNTRNWVGSTNQSFYYLSDRYNCSIESDKEYQNSIEIRISDTVLINGEANIVKELKDC